MVNMCSGSSSVGANEAQRNTALADMTLAEFRYISMICSHGGIAKAE